MQPSAIDLREKLLQAYDQSLGSQRALAGLCGVSRAFVEKLLRRRTTGEIAPRPHGGGRRPYCDATTGALVSQWVREHPDATLEELALQLQQQCALRVSLSTLSRLLTRGAAAPKKSLHASGPDTARVQHARAGYWQRIAGLDPQRLKFVDESGVNLAMDTDVFRTSVRQVLGPTLRPGDIVVLDNLGVHKALGIQQMLARRQARLLYLPPDSPDLSPIELCGGTGKVSLRKAKARTRDALDAAITHVLPLITPTEACRWFIHCGSARQ